MYKTSVCPDGAHGGLPHSSTISHPLTLILTSNHSKKNFLSSLPLPPLHHSALRLQLHPSRPERGCHYASLLLPLASVASASRPLLSRALVLVVLALPAFVTRAAHLAEPSPVLVAVVLARRRTLLAPTPTVGIDQPRSSPLLCCICLFQLF
jgi:hypothetical protein